MTASKNKDLQMHITSKQLFLQTNERLRQFVSGMESNQMYFPHNSGAVFDVNYAASLYNIDPRLNRRSM